jgi:cardiolipin synthase
LVTISRGLCGPLVTYLLVVHDAHFLAFWVFVGAIASDLLDGFAARLLNAYSRLGLLLDPLADKILTDTVWIALWWTGDAPGWLAAATLLRDGIVATAWVWGGPRGLRWRPNAFGQISVAFEGTAVSILVFHGPWIDVHWPSVGTAVGVLGMLLSLGSVIQYLIEGPEQGGPTQPLRATTPHAAAD